MKRVLGVIIEFNPLHHGHKYFLDKAIEMIKPDVVIAIMTTNFSMRGDISVIDKFTKTSLALDLGIDIVMELPFPLAVASGDYFGTNCVDILAKMNITELVFGAELESITELQKINKLTDNPLFDNYVKENLSSGYSYSTSCNKALGKLTDDINIINNYSLPNNTLGLIYLKALTKYPYITPNVIKRVSNDYYDESLSSKISSATSIRLALKDNVDVSNYCLCKKEDFICLNSSEDKLLLLIKYLFITKNIKDINYLGVKEGIENRILNVLPKSKSLDELVKLACTKRYNPNYLRRLLLHIIMETPKETKQIGTYLRILGFTQKGMNYIKELPKETKQSIITTLKDSTNEISLSELKASMLYSLITDKPMLYINEYKIPIRR